MREPRFLYTTCALYGSVSDIIHVVELIGGDMEQLHKRVTAIRNGYEQAHAQAPRPATMNPTRWHTSKFMCYEFVGVNYDVIFKWIDPAPRR